MSQAGRRSNGRRRIHIGGFCLITAALAFVGESHTASTTRAFIRPSLMVNQGRGTSEQIIDEGSQALQRRVQSFAEGRRTSPLPRRTRAKGHSFALLEAPQRYGSHDWLENLRSLPFSRIAKRISGHLYFNTAWAAFVAFVYDFIPSYHVPWHVSPIPHSLMGTALGLLLVFRTNAAYDRFWEARKVWGTVTNTCRNLARTGAVALDRRYHSRLSMLISAFPLSLKAHLQRIPVGTDLEALLPNWEAHQVRMDPNPPALICMKISHLVSEGLQASSKASDYYCLYMENRVGDLINCLGMAERILLTPVPASYSRHTSRFLSLYCLTLPLVLVPQLEFYTIPVMGAMCWGLFSIEEIGHLIEEPFSISTKQLPLDRMSKTIAKDVQRLMRVPDNECPELVDEDLLTSEDRALAEYATGGDLSSMSAWRQAMDSGGVLMTVMPGSTADEGGGGDELMAALHHASSLDEGGGGELMAALYHTSSLDERGEGSENGSSPTAAAATKLMMTGMSRAGGTSAQEAARIAGLSPPSAFVHTVIEQQPRKASSAASSSHTPSPPSP